MSDTQTIGQETDVPGKVTKDQVIVKYVRSNLDLQQKLKRLEDRCRAMQVELEKQNEMHLEGNIPKAWIASFVENLFNRGKVPTPANLLKKGVPFSVRCDEKSVTFGNQGLRVYVTFEANGYSDGSSFNFLLAPESREEGYEHFHHGFTRVVPPAKRVRKKARVKPPASSS